MANSVRRLDVGFAESSAGIPSAVYDPDSQVVHNWRYDFQPSAALEISIDNVVILEVDADGTLLRLEMIGNADYWPHHPLSTLIQDWPHQMGRVIFDVSGITQRVQFDDRISLMSNSAGDELVAYISVDFASATPYRVAENIYVLLRDGRFEGVAVRNLITGV